MKKSTTVLDRQLLSAVGCWLSFSLITPLLAAEHQGSVFPTRALCISAPHPESVSRFNRFIETELAPRGVNTLILRVDFHFQFKSHPELTDYNALSSNQVQSIVKTCKAFKIRLIPQVNLLGHQSWQTHTGKLLEIYPDFDETPSIDIPAKYQWPNDDGLYCKSYCSLHPDVHEVVFACVDEVCDAFEADAFHAGLDEVFFHWSPEVPPLRGQGPGKTVC